MSDLNKTVLISTIQPVGGGVPQMVRFIMSCLARRGYNIRLAYYEPYSVSPELSVPLQRLLLLPFSSKEKRAPQVRVAEFEGVPAIGVGCWAPELEFTNYWKSSRWQSEIERCDFHICVSGSNLAALPYYQLKIPFLAWVATPWQGDREHRVKRFPWYRRCLDYVIISPVCKYLERRIHQTGGVMALSKYTRDCINLDSSDAVKNVLPMPVDTKRFIPNLDVKNSSESIKIGFIGRFEDPRKNIDLLIRAFSLCMQHVLQNTNKRDSQLVKLELVLIGDTVSTKTKGLLRKLNITEYVTTVPYVANENLPEKIQAFSLFVIPSHQEGLCIAALEAMSCGVPVISTQCGGPESYLRHKENGLLVKSNPEDLKTAILQIIEDIDNLNEYSRRARQTVEENFSIPVAEQLFWQYFAEIYPESAQFDAT